MCASSYVFEAHSVSIVLLFCLCAAFPDADAVNAADLSRPGCLFHQHCPAGLAMFATSLARVKVMQVNMFAGTSPSEGQAAVPAGR